MTAPLPPRVLATALAIAGAVAVAPAAGAPAVGDPVPGEVLVGLADGASAATRAAVERRSGVRLGARLTPRGARLARVLGPGTTARALARLRADPAVRWAEPNRVHRALAVPSDPLFPVQWGLRNTGQAIQGVRGTAGADIRAAEAWNLTTGSDRVRVAVLDGGVDGGSPDLAPNTGVVNPGESGDGREANGVDDDQNGFIDDWRGWDFVDGDGDPSDEDPDRHGSTVAGVIAARGGDGGGIAGVTWSSRIIPVRGLDEDGIGSTADLAAGITYAASMGARILNASFGGPHSILIEEAIAEAPQMLVVAAAGNGGADQVGDDNDAWNPSSRTYPCALGLENVVCVAATNQDDELAGFSNYGAVRVDLAAPGVRIVGPPAAGSTSAKLLSGTSFSTPHVAGVAALVLAANPDASTRGLRRAVLEGVRPLPALAGSVATGGRLDAMGALGAVPPPGPGPGGTTGPAIDTGATSARLTGSVPAADERLSYHFEYGTTAGYGAATPSRALAPGGTRAVAEDVARLPAGRPLHHRLVVEGIAGITRGADVASRLPPPAPVAAPPTAPVSTPAPKTGTGTRPRASRRVARPTARVRRAGRTWRLVLTLRQRAVVSAVVQRRRPAAGRRTVRYATVRGLRRRGLATGVRRLSLGRLAPGPHRVRVRVRVKGARGAVTLSPRFMVPRRR